MNAFSSISTGVIIGFLIIDIVVRFRNRDKAHPILREIFSDFNSRLSFARVACAFLLIIALLVALYGWYHPTAWESVKYVFNTMLETSKWLYISAKLPETVANFSAPVQVSRVDK